MSKSDLALIIPTYNEWEMVLRPLASFALQDPIRSVRSSVFIAINQPANANEEVTRGNHTTAQIIRALAKRQMPAWLSNEPIPVLMNNNFSPAFDARMFRMSVREMAQTILDNPAIQIHEINLWEWEKASPESNLWITRDIASKEAFQHLHDRWRVVMTDADAMFSDRYFYYLLARGNKSGFWPRVPMYFSQDEIEASHSVEPASFVEWVIEWLSIDLLFEDNNLTKLVTSGVGDGFHKWVGDSRMMIPMSFEWPSMFFSKEVFEKAGGFPHLPWASDTMFYERVLRTGEHPVYSDEYVVGILDRTEERTFCGNSNLTKSMMEQQTISLQGRKAYIAIHKILGWRDVTKKSTFYTLFQETFKDLIPHEDIKILWTYWQHANYTLASRWFNEAVGIVLRRNFPLSFRDALAEIEREIKSGKYHIDQDYFLSMLPPAYQALAYLDSLKKI